MASNNTILLDLKIGTAQIDLSLGNIKTALDDLSVKINNIGTTFENAFSFDLDNVVAFRDMLSQIADNSKTLVDNLSTANEMMKPQEDSIWSQFINGVYDFNILSDGLGNFDKITKAIFDTKSRTSSFFSSLIPNTTNLIKDIAGDISTLVSNIKMSIVEGPIAHEISTFFNDYRNAANNAKIETDNFTTIFPKLGSALGAAKFKIAELGSSIGTFVAAIPGHIASVALDTETWVKNTAAKVGNSVAQWAQNAATTAWTGICTAATAVTSAFGVVMTFLTSPIGLVVIGITALIVIIALLIANWDAVCAKAKEVWTAIQEKLSAFDEFLKNIFAKDFTEQFGAFGAVLNVFFNSVEGVWNAIKKVFGGIVDFVKNVFAGNWSAAWDSIVQIFTGIWEGIVGYFKPPLNAIIGFINGLISAIVNAVNFVIRAVNKLSIDIPNWDIFGSLAGQTFGLNIPLVSSCEIPYLAQGAVLPANRPFMAIVGDQRHGTNVEAPLATIQEAVAIVMEDQTAAIVAGFNASIGIQRELLSAVLGIRIGDEVIGRAADRYFAKRAAMGGY